jgi:predicted DNA-binding transcriptional regulator AlpA
MSTQTNARIGAPAGNVQPSPRRPDAWRVNDALRQLSISRATLYKMVKRGYLHPIYLGGRTLIPDAEIQRLVGGVSRSA